MSDPKRKILAADCVLCPIDDRTCYSSPCIDHGCMGDRDTIGEDGDQSGTHAGSRHKDNRRTVGQTEDR